MGRGFTHLLLTLVCFLGPAATARPIDRYYLIVFAYEGNPNLARESHTFATFVHDGPAGLEKLTISWLPDYRQPIRPLPVVRGHNYTLEETLEIAGRRHRIYYWGPFESTASLYEAARRRAERLRPGIYQYKMIDFHAHVHNAINCIRAVSEVTGHLETGTNWGRPASLQVLQHFRPYLLDYPNVHENVSTRIRLRELIEGRG